MAFRIVNKFHGSVQSFNMTPIIDIVFLLIIFFLVVCQFIEAENFPVVVPDDCDFAQDSTDTQRGLTTVTVMKAGDEREFAVGSEKVSASDSAGIINEMAGLLDVSFKGLPADRRIVTLRIDSDVDYSNAQYALAAVAASSATDIQLAVIKDKQTGSGVKPSKQQIP